MDYFRLLKQYDEIISRQFNGAFLKIEFGVDSPTMKIYIMGKKLKMVEEINLNDSIDLGNFVNRMEFLIDKYKRGCIEYANSNIDEVI